MHVQFWSSTEYGGFAEGLLRELNAKGYDSRQCWQVSEKQYRSAKSRPARIALRLRQYIIYPMQLLLALVINKLRSRGSNTVMVVTTNTFFAPLLATCLHRRVVHLVYDLFPEALIHSGKWREGTMKVKCVRWITRQTLRRSQMNVFLGERLKEYVDSIYGETPNSSIIAVGADQALFSTSPVDRPSSVSDKPVILYCGNLGNMHDAETFFAYWGTSEVSVLPSVQWKFHCSGPKREDLVKTVSRLPLAMADCITLGSGLKQKDWIEEMERADVALVTMTPGSERVVVPSKSYSAMMAGQAILAIAPENSDLVDLIKAAACGWWVAPGDTDALAKVVDALASDPQELMSKRENAFRYAHAHLGQDSLARQWQEVLR